MAFRKKSWFDLVVTDAPLWIWVASFFGVVVTFGLLYAVLTPLGHGMAQGKEGGFDFGQGLYFSVVTVSSLGYGDVHPEGMGKVLAGLEVLMGLGFIGIVIAKLTSKRVSDLVSRLFVSETKRQLLRFEELFDSRQDELIALNEQIREVYQPTPGQGSDEVLDSSGVGDSLRSTLDELQKSSDEFLDYLGAEGLDRNYFGLAPASSLLRVAEAMKRTIAQLGQSIVSLSSQSNPRILKEVFTFESMVVMDRVVKVQSTTCATVIQSRKIDSAVQAAFEEVNVHCTRVMVLLNSAWGQPDQSIQAS